MELLINISVIFNYFVFTGLRLLFTNWAILVVYFSRVYYSRLDPHMPN